MVLRSHLFPSGYFTAPNLNFCLIPYAYVIICHRCKIKGLYQISSTYNIELKLLFLLLPTVRLLAYFSDFFLPIFDILSHFYKIKMYAHFKKSTVERKLPGGKGASR